MDIRNKEGLWINSKVFSEVADHFTKYGYYCGDPSGSPGYEEFWTEEIRKRKYGYTVGGCTITGDHYNYLNYCPIMKFDIKDPTNGKVEGFPDFWDTDFEYFWVREICKGTMTSILGHEGKATVEDAWKLYLSLNLDVKIKKEDLVEQWNLIVGKKRRSGYSLKNAGIASNNYYLHPNKLTLLCAIKMGHLNEDGLFTKVRANINFINDNTAFALPAKVVDKNDWIKSSYLKQKDGIWIEDGFKSEIGCLSFNDNTGAGRGKDALDILVEESGDFGKPGHLKKSLKALEDCVKAGAFSSGLITVFGTSGDLNTASMDYSQIHMNPKAYGFLDMQNIWDENSEGERCGFFHPVTRNMEGFYDENGNSNVEGALAYELGEREKRIAAGATSRDISDRMQEKPIGPKEAFASVSGNTYPTTKLFHRLNYLRKAGNSKGIPVVLDIVGGEVVVHPILNFKAGDPQPILSYTNEPEDTRGCVVLFENPDHELPKGTYKIGYDPVRQDQGTSLAAIVVYKGQSKKGLRNNIVAEWIGRREDTDENDTIAVAFAMLYNTKVMFENEVPSLKTFCRRRKLLKYLAFQPDEVIKANVKNSKTSRIYGCHMNTKLLAAGIRYVKSWLIHIENYNENEEPITTIDHIYSTRLLEELINFNLTGNFDMHSSLIMCLIQEEEIMLKDLNQYEVASENKNDVADFFKKAY
tara:strand:- start:9061 stop:11148 length:2088 start_codon:yes stop_codon:yes gene_type:complete